jgi:peptidoglycan/LPS O-acetylase OafA/YrhL
MFLPVFGTEAPGFAWGGFVAIALGVVALQHAMSRPAWLEAPALVWVGKISYGLYLWHYVYLRTELPLVTALVLSVATAAASWYLVETPIRKLRERLEAPRVARQAPRVAYLADYRRVPQSGPVATAWSGLSALSNPHDAGGAVGGRRVGGFE